MSLDGVNELKKTVGSPKSVLWEVKGIYPPTDAQRLYGYLLVTTANRLYNNGMRIGYIGNFDAPYSTENDRKWSLQMLGHDIVKFQENRTTVDDIKRFDLDLLIYSHTHGWKVEGLKKFFRTVPYPTVSVHLDKWAGLEREADIGKEATWFTDFRFMADWSPRARKLYPPNTFQLKPGVIQRDCYMANPDPIRFPFEVVFTGSSTYHKEYPFREKMVNFLKETYGDRFGHFGAGGYPAVRGHDLNVLYATAKVVVGDVCFANDLELGVNYVSDRFYEVRGRGGFLVHPRVKGYKMTGVATYKPQNLESLKEVIDFYLENDTKRQLLRIIGFNYVKQNCTYTHRSQEMLDVIKREMENKTSGA